MINDPTHLLKSSSSCIDLIFTSQPNLITESGIHPSLHPNSHLIQEKNNVYKSYRNSKNNNNIQYLRTLKLLQEDLHNEIEVSKSNYYSRMN